MERHIIEALTRYRVAENSRSKKRHIINSVLSSVTGRFLKRAKGGQSYEQLTDRKAYDYVARRFSELYNLGLKSISTADDDDDVSVTSENADQQLNEEDTCRVNHDSDFSVSSKKAEQHENEYNPSSFEKTTENSENDVSESINAMGSKENNDAQNLHILDGFLV